MQVRLVGVTVVPDRGDRLTPAYNVAHMDRDAALLEVGHRHEEAGSDVDHQVVGVVAVGAGWIVGVSVGHLDDPSVGRRQH
jgi:hypothetical protein